MTERDAAISKADHAYHTDTDANTVTDGAGDLGAFAFGTVAETVRTRHVASSGNA